MKSPSRKEYLKERFKEPATCNMWQCCCRSHVAKKVKPRQLFKQDNKVLQKKSYSCKKHKGNSITVSIEDIANGWLINEN